MVGRDQRFSRLRLRELIAPARLHSARHDYDDVSVGRILFPRDDQPAAIRRGLRFLLRNDQPAVGLVFEVVDQLVRRGLWQLEAQLQLLDDQSYRARLSDAVIVEGQSRHRPPAPVL